MKLLNGGNHKTVKGELFGWKTYGLHLSPFNISGNNVCPNASAGCAAACLNTAGRGIMRTVQEARIRKTQFFFNDRKGFLCQLLKEIKSAIKSAARKELNPCFRLNLTSDIAWEKYIIPSFKSHQFYDYTKSKQRMRRFLDGSSPKTITLPSHARKIQAKNKSESSATVEVMLRLSLEIIYPNSGEESK